MRSASRSSAAFRRYTTGTGYLITPVVGWMEPPVDYRPDPTEVEECFEVPFEFLIDIGESPARIGDVQGPHAQYYAHSLWPSLYLGRDRRHAGDVYARAVERAQGWPSSRRLKSAPDSG